MIFDELRHGPSTSLKTTPAFRRELNPAASACGKMVSVRFDGSAVCAMDMKSEVRLDQFENCRGIYPGNLEKSGNPSNLDNLGIQMRFGCEMIQLHTVLLATLSW